MEKQPELVIKILERMSQAGLLDRILLIGSWCTSFYKDYFKGTDYAPIIKTRDIDFLVRRKDRFPKQVDLSDLVADLGFEVGFAGNSGYMKLENDELVLEFLVPEVGPAKDKPYPLPDLKFNAQPLRHLAMLWRDPIIVSVSGFEIKIPHPADYCLHKLIIFTRRKNPEKKKKDFQSAIQVLDALLEKEGEKNLKMAFADLSQNEKKEISKVLSENQRLELVRSLE